MTRLRQGHAPSTSISSPVTSSAATWRGGRVAEGGGLLNRYRALKPYRGFESPPLRPRYGILIATPARETATSAHASAASAMPRIQGRARLGVAAATPSTASPATAV